MDIGIPQISNNVMQSGYVLIDEGRVGPVGQYTSLNFFSIRGCFYMEAGQPVAWAGLLDINIVFILCLYCVNQINH